MRLTETERFWLYIVKGPAPEDCGLWTGAISDDGYGRFWMHDGARQKAVRPQRYAYELAIGQLLPSDAMVLHSCDVPTCAHADADPHVSHVRKRSGCAPRSSTTSGTRSGERRPRRGGRNPPPTVQSYAQNAHRAAKRHLCESPLLRHPVPPWVFHGERSVLDGGHNPSRVPRREMNEQLSRLFVR